MQKREIIKKFILEKFGKKLKPNTFRILKENFYSIYKDMILETNYLNKEIKISERLFHILNDIFEIRKCSCGKNLGYLDINRGYYKYCKDCQYKRYRCGKMFDNKDAILCSYGCNKEAKYILSNKKYCCEKTFGKCEVIINKTVRFGINHKYTYDDWINKYPILKDFEEVRDIDKTLEVKCKHCKKWFTPTRNQLYFRIFAIKRKIGNINMYLFCSDNCKKESPEYGIKINEETLSEYRKYRRLVDIKTRKTLKDHINKILNIKNLKGNSLDHKFSVVCGFNNNVSSDIISHWKNLEVIPLSENFKKHKKCSIAIEQLVKEIKELNDNAKV